MIDLPDYNAMDDEAFRRLVHDWIVANYPEELRFPPERMHWDQCGEWYLKLAKQGWLAPGWPREHGGMGLDANKLLIFMDADPPWSCPGPGCGRRHRTRTHP